jgi:hypothetical protein
VKFHVLKLIMFTDQKVTDVAWNSGTLLMLVDGHDHNCDIARSAR